MRTASPFFFLAAFLFACAEEAAPYAPPANAGNGDGDGDGDDSNAGEGGSQGDGDGDGDGAGDGDIGIDEPLEDDPSVDDPMDQGLGPNSTFDPNAVYAVFSTSDQRRGIFRLGMPDAKIQVAFPMYTMPSSMIIEPDGQLLYAEDLRPRPWWHFRCDVGCMGWQPGGEYTIQSTMNDVFLNDGPCGEVEDTTRVLIGHADKEYCLKDGKTYNAAGDMVSDREILWVGYDEIALTQSALIDLETREETPIEGLPPMRSILEARGDSEGFLVVVRERKDPVVQVIDEMNTFVDDGEEGGVNGQELPSTREIWHVGMDGEAELRTACDLPPGDVQYLRAFEYITGTGDLEDDVIEVRPPPLGTLGALDANGALFSIASSSDYYDEFGDKPIVRCNPDGSTETLMLSSNTVLQRVIRIDALVTGR